ncbi:uncharacterized protein B0I36DRAFT_232773 [Microdochium trichocladiopsis]|uniref:Uncharacterized protein n=1 Tax=Microdochium trichocladiopsis TaxID=1682393 RepID=A0A9P8YHN9_9PEZI|nr:uncharacterized protein B0I36DRAFT_232773 [Microdochium trichocladiopsis]KAH7040579.1 hypothetical protein B0I36DRAFT_232773 [Microdochium trichocladiopsis]
MSQEKPKQTLAKPREPPPALFLHPSPAASHVSLPGIAAATGGASHASGSGVASSTEAPTRMSLEIGSASRGGGPIAAPPLGRTGSLLNPRNNIAGSNSTGMPPRLVSGESSRATDRTDALWAEMQATLEEAELSATGGTRVFGPEHDRKLAELRMAQIALAQAWARSEADDAVTENNLGEPSEVGNLKGALGDVGIAAAAVGLGGSIIPPSGVGKAGPSDATDGGKSTVGSASNHPGSSGGPGGLSSNMLGGKLEEETERDILLARKRREANDKYFGRVDDGVRDVVAKLEEVALAMRAVEQETRDVWGDESMAGSMVVRD